MNVPEDLRYTSEHEWIRSVGDGVFRIGITDYAQDQLGDVVYIELPSEGKTVGPGDLMAEIESTKSVGEVYAPFAGSVSVVPANAPLRNCVLMNESTVARRLSHSDSLLGSNTAHWMPL